jgi:hypothetical protein
MVTISQWLCGLATDHIEGRIKRDADTRSLWVECPDCGWRSPGITLPPIPVDPYQSETRAPQPKEVHACGILAV